MSHWDAMHGVDQGLRQRMRSEERRIGGQHERLDSLCQEVCAILDQQGPAAAIGNYQLYVAALEAHMTLEEEVYFPALHGLRGDLSGDLGSLVETHQTIRSEAEYVKRLLEGRDRDASRLALERLGQLFVAHEQVEEDLIARVNAESTSVE